MEQIEHWAHQREALDKLRATAKRGIKRIVLQAPPGAGKTEIAVDVVKATLGKSFAIAFTVPFLNLVDQTVNRFVKRGIDAHALGVMQADHGMTRPQAPVQVARQPWINRPGWPTWSSSTNANRYEVIEKWKQTNPEIIHRPAPRLGPRACASNGTN